MFCYLLSWNCLPNIQH